jgi:hypothetical protein
MRTISFVSMAFVGMGLLGGGAVAGCSGAGTSGFGRGSGGTSGGFGDSTGDGSTVQLTTDSGQGGGNTSTTTAIYANSDTALYSVDPTTKVVTLIGQFEGAGGNTVTDLAVNAEGDLYVNTETVVYKATLPAGSGPVSLSQVARIATQGYQSFYALAFAPPGVLGSGETLVGGDGNGEVWSIDTTSGAIQDLGNFGPVPSDRSRIFGLSGDIVFYLDGSGKPTGLATIRSCDSSGSCDESDDYLAGIDMTALVDAYTSHTPAASLLLGLYGGSATSMGPGTGYGRLFGLGAWGGEVYAFSRVGSSGSPPPELVLIDTATGAGTAATATPAFTSGGWSGAGVSTRTSVTVPPPPPTPK